MNKSSLGKGHYRNEGATAPPDIHHMSAELRKIAMLMCGNDALLAGNILQEALSVHTMQTRFGDDVSAFETCCESIKDEIEDRFSTWELIRDECQEICIYLDPSESYESCAGKCRIGGDAE